MSLQNVIREKTDIQKKINALSNNNIKKYVELIHERVNEFSLNRNFVFTYTQPGNEVKNPPATAKPISAPS